MRLQGKLQDRHGAAVLEGLKVSRGAFLAISLVAGVLLIVLASSNAQTANEKPSSNVSIAITNNSRQS